MNPGTRIDEHILDRAEQILQKQTFVPTSPAAFDESGGICLCAAGILARAGLSCRFSTEDAQQFSRECIASGTVKPLIVAFHRLGWPSVLCLEMVKQNDAANSRERASVIIRQLQALRAT